MRTAYISGPVTGTDNYKERFATAEKRLQDKGFDVVNPVRRTVHLPGKHKALGLPPPEWEDYMRECIRAISRCDTIYMLHGWQDSRGARLERHIAKELGMETLYEEEE